MVAECIRTDRYMFALWDEPDGGELYDMQEDPHATRNLYHDPAHRDVSDAHCVRCWFANAACYGSGT